MTAIYKSKTYKFLGIDDYQAISDEVYEYIINHTQVLQLENIFVDQEIDSMLSCCPQLSEFLNKHQLTPKRLATIVCAGSDHIAMHKDNDGQRPYIRILWPIKNCQGSKTKIWLIPENAGKVMIDTNGIVYTWFPHDQKRLQIDEFELTSPVLFNASCAHSVHPTPGSTETRISFTMGFDRDLPISNSIEAWQTLGY
jgi:hypothetical protein